MPQLTIPDTQLLLVARVWTLYYKGQLYMRLLDAKSRQDAEQMCADLLFQAAENRNERSENTVHASVASRTSKNPRSPQARGGV